MISAPPGDTTMRITGGFNQMRFLENNCIYKATKAAIGKQKVLPQVISKNHFETAPCCYYAWII